MEITGLVTTIWVLSLPKTMLMVFKERLSASAVLARSIKILRWQMGSAKSQEHDFRKKRSYIFFKIHRTSDIHMGTAAPLNHASGLYGTYISRGSVCKFNKSAWMATGGRKNPGARFSNESSRVFKTHWTSDTPKSPIALSNQAHGLCRRLPATHRLQCHLNCRDGN